MAGLVLSGSLRLRGISRPGLAALVVGLLFLGIAGTWYVRQDPLVLRLFFFKQKTAYEISSRDWSSDVCSSDLLLERHDRSACEILCYSLSDSADRVTQEIVERTDVWRSVPYTPRAELAELIHRDAVDVLVDLSGHSGIPAFDLFAYRPAPVQASWLGYLCTTGLTRIDYRITDAYSDPPGTADRLHTEVLVRLPHVQWCYRPFVSIEPSGAPPCERHGFFTFGSFNQTAKLSRSV